MKKKIAVLLGLVMGVVLFFGAAPTKAEACAPVIRGNHVEMVSVTKHSKLCLKGEVKVTDNSPTAVRKAKIFVVYQGTTYKDACAKYLRSVELFDEKGEATGEFEHIYKFSGCKTCK